jgi:hypothetical protein
MDMKKTIVAIAAVATVAIATLSAPTTADARNGRNAAAIGLGVVGGVIIGSAIANSQPRYAPQPGYVVYDGYRGRHPVRCRDGYWARRPVHDRWGNVVGWSRARFVCP